MAFISQRGYDIDFDSIITSYNIAVADTACEILGKVGRKKKPWITSGFSPSVMRDSNISLNN